jgi:hypothetical protein
MTSGKSSLISQEARNLLADQYDAEGKPWFAHDIRHNKGKQFNAALIVLTRVLEG